MIATDMMRDHLPLIASDGDAGFLIAADDFDDSDDKANKTFGRLLRLYVDIQTYVRMSQPIPVSMADEFKLLNDSFEMPNRQYLYHAPLGPFYTGLLCSAERLASNLHYLEDQPVREVQLSRVMIDNDFAMILRNHRFQALKRLTISPDGRIKDVAGLAATVRGMTAHSLMSLTFQWGVHDRLGLLKAAFLGNRTIQKGCELFLGTTRTCVKK